MVVAFNSLWSAPFLETAITDLHLLSLFLYPKNQIPNSSSPMASSISCYSVFIFMALMLLASAQSGPCDDIYLVREGESLHSISAKCDDPFIVDYNPQIQDSDDVFPGLLIKITPSLNSRKLFFRKPNSYNLH
ncbi:uncharacterized protein LOC111499354 [Cucurbita maxima]|uniref:Uncharacterized protein LOC111499354 n=1 Tax=Cucurbita maxima TaxID=3661 RepID=A0A6J1KYG6_CUCMA|nr:uncharacterized protein LOC111499354 [Cucurbita maxima]